MTINLYVNTITMTALIPPFLCLPSASVTTQLSKLRSAMLNQQHLNLINVSCKHVNLKCLKASFSFLSPRSLSSASSRTADSKGEYLILLAYLLNLTQV